MGEDAPDRHHRRESDRRGPQLTRALERFLLWAGVLGCVSTGAVFYTRLKDTIPKTDALEEKVRQLDTASQVARATTDQRWADVLARLDRIERKLDRRIP